MTNNSVAIVDYEMGNLFSVIRACKYVGLNPVITADKNVIASAAATILPGVGAFGDAMANLKRLDLIEPIRDFIESGRPFMGICLGLQLLMSESFEFGTHNGLDIIRGRVVKFKSSGGMDYRVKVPQVGWNEIVRPKGCGPEYWSDTPLEGIRNGEHMYFVHSYYCILDKAEVALSCTEYEGTTYTSSINHKNIFACQFHPEKSAAEGLRVYSNWAGRILFKKDK